MKRTLIVAAVAALGANAALAQSSVTVFGRVNTSVEYQKNIAVDGKQAVLQNNASRLGFKGTEDLGGGLKADFYLEHRFNSDTGTTTGDFWSGDAWVGLSGGFGNIRAGRLTSAAYYATADWIGMHNHDTGTSEDKLYTYLSGNKNTVSYQTPNFAGFVGEFSVSAGEGVDDNKVYNLAGNYDAGPLHLGVGYERQAESKNSQLALRAVYELGAFTFGGYYQLSDLKDLGAALRDPSSRGFDAGKRNLFRLAGMYTLGASEFHVNVGRADDWDNVDGSKATQWTLAYNYNLSKRTKVYAFYTKVDNGRNLSYFGATGANDTVLDPSSFAVGVRHNF
ncbi:porin [Aquincola tertiaricarbonis]|uniref:Porin n=1 Tax=Aquincola tertiaricarbonis TaxID=391953 RepID=A0ABY4SEC4_AQUTE|nr:porin [Aquincola tertiaricarbonis]URI11671.1 porin [Aquincola tertiaricarbonis]